MKYIVSFILLVNSAFFFSQNKTISVDKLILVGQMDRPEDKFSLEINLAELLSKEGIEVIPSLNLVKQGAPMTELISDSTKNVISGKNINTFLLVSVRGYDKKFRATTKFETLDKELTSSHLFPLYRDEIVSITFEFSFFREDKMIHTELLKINNVGSRDAVIKKLRKKLPKKISNWKF